MRKTTKSPGEKIVKDIKRATRKQYSSEEKIRIVLDGLRGEAVEAAARCAGENFIPMPNRFGVCCFQKVGHLISKKIPWFLPRNEQKRA